MKYKILQINDIAKCDYAFTGWDRAKEKFSIHDYKLVYTGEILDEILDDRLQLVDALDKIFEMFNYTHPEDFKGHSLSVSDIVILTNSDSIRKMYYCDLYGWSEISDKFLRKMNYNEMIEYLLAELEEEKKKMLKSENNKFGYLYMLCNDMGIIEG